MNKFVKYFVIFLQHLKILSAISMRLVQLTGKHKKRVHPKHLISGRPWYIKFLSKSDLVLDVGCANGQHTLKAARYCKKIIGFDIDASQLEIANDDKEKKNINNVEFKQGSAERVFPFKNNSFDKVLILDVLEHLNRRKFVINQIHRMLRPGGLLLLAVPNKDTSWKKLQANFKLPYFSDPDHKIEYSQVGLLSFLKKNNFIPLLIQPVVYDTPLAPLIDLVGGVSLTYYKKLVEWKKNYAKKYPQESNGFEIVAKKL